MLPNKSDIFDGEKANIHKEEEIHFGNLAMKLASRSRNSFPCMISVALPQYGWKNRQIKILPAENMGTRPNVTQDTFTSFELLVEHIHGNENGSYIYIVTSMDSTGKIQCATISNTQTITLELGDDGLEHVNNKVDNIIPH